MNQTTGTKQRKQQQLHLHNHGNSTNYNHQYSSGNGSTGGLSRSQQQPQSYVLKTLYHVATATNIVAKKIGLHQIAQNQNPQLIRLGGWFVTLITTYVVLSSLLILLHSYANVSNNRNGSIISQQQQQATTPLYLTNSEQDLVSRILGIDPKASTARKSQQCTSSVNIRIPPISLRKGKSQYVTEVEYQNQAVQLVHNIRALLGMAAQLGIRQSMMNPSLDDLPTASINTTANSTFAAGISSSVPLQLLTQPSQNLQFKSFDNAVIMDFGCGPGRLLIGLLSANVCFTKYIGVDVNNKDIQWLTDMYIDNNSGNDRSKQKLVMTGTQKIQRQKQRQRKMRYLDQNGLYQQLDEDLFQFIRIDVKNERYNKNGRKLDTDSLEKQERIVFPSIEIHDGLVHTVDIMILRSVFSHMLASDIYHHLRALHPILKTNTGVMIVSLFLNTIPDSPVETIITHEEQQRGNHLVYISKQVFETMVYETGYSIVLYMSHWNMGEDVYVLSSNGKKPPRPLLDDNDDVNVEGETKER